MAKTRFDINVDNLDDIWVTDDYIADPDNLPQPCGWRILIRPVPPRTKTESGLHLPDSVIHREEITTTIGRIVAVGPLAWQREDWGHEPWAKVGDYVLHAKFGGKRIEYGGVKIVIFNDDEVIAVVTKPDKVSR